MALKYVRSVFRENRPGLQASLFFLVLLLVLSLVPFQLGRFDALAGKIADAGHLWFYTVLGFIFGRVHRSPLLVGFGLLITAGTLELVQPFFERDASVSDFFVSSVGGYFGVWCRVTQLRVKQALVGLFLSVLVVIPIFFRFYVLQVQEAEFPNLLPSDRILLSDLWVPSRPNWDYSAKLKRGPEGILVTPKVGAPWPGIVYRNFEIPWSGMKALEITIEAPDVMNLMVRIDDDQDCREFANRFNAQYLLHPGTNTLTIPVPAIEAGPEKRNLNLNGIRWLRIFTEVTKGRLGFTLRGVRLLP